MSFADTLFQRAVSTGDAQVVRTMLAAGADVNARNENGHTPIIYAIVAGQYHLVSLLLGAGANPTLRDHTGLSAIDWAKRKGRPDVAQSLTTTGTNTAPIPPEDISPRPSVDEKQRPSISADEKSRRFIAGLRQRQEEEANRRLANNELQSQPSETEQTNREVTDERRRSFRETAAREEAIVEPKREAADPRQRLEEEANRKLANDELQSQPSETEQTNREVVDERQRIFRETAAREALRQRLEDEANRKLANDELQAEPSETEQTNREVVDERQRIFRETAAREEALVEREGAIIEPKRVPVPATSERPATPNVAFDVSTLPKSSSPTSTTGFESHTSSHRKRCPRCGATYNSEILAYCVYHEVPLIGADEPIPVPAETSSSTLLWVLVLIAVTVGGLGGLYVTGALFKGEPINTPVPAALTPITQKGIPTLEKRLAGKEVSLPEAEVPPNTVKEPTTITVHVRIERDGRVSSASATDGDQVFREAAIKAAKTSSFSADKLRGRSAEGTISYTFK